MPPEALSSYFAEIQNLPGLNFSGKFKSIILTARKLSKTLEQSKEISKQSLEFALEEVPEPLKPLLRVEIANILRIKEEIISGLKSEDSFVVDRALKAKWFFEEYSSLFEQEIFPFVSIQTRSQVIKALGYNLKDFSAAEQCYNNISSLYGIKEASFLLLACSDTFIASQRHLSDRVLKLLFSKYPEAIIEHLKAHNNVKKYKLYNFLPKLLKNYPKDFVKLMKKYGSCSPLSKARTKLFLKTCKEDLIQNAYLFLPCLDLEVTSAALSEDEWIVVISSSFPTEVNRFYLYSHEEKLKFVSEEKKCRILLTAFQNCYNLPLEHEKYDSFMKYLPEEQRIHRARLKLEEKEDMAENLVYWISFLSNKEAMERFELLISTSGSSKDRCLFLRGMIDCSGEKLLETLEFVWKKHRNENCANLIRIFENLDTFEKNHWEIIYKIIKMLYAKGESNYKIFEVVRKAWEQDLIVSEEAMEFLAELFISEKYSLSLHLSDEKFLKEFLPVLESKEVKDSGICDIVDVLYKVNKEEMNIRKFPWVLERVEKMFEEDNWTAESLKKLLKIKDKDLYHQFVKEEIDVRDPRIVKKLHNNPEEVDEKWEEYVSSIYKGIATKSVQRFVSFLRWHKLGGKLLSHCLEQMKKCDKSLIVLASMVQGEDLEKLILEVSEVLEVPKEENFVQAKRNHQIQTSVARAINAVTPPISLEFLRKFCKGDSIHMILRCLYAVARRKQANKVIVFAEELMEQSFTVKKHGVRLYLEVLGQENVLKFWNKEEMRPIVFDWALKKFRKEQSEDSWALLKRFVEEMEFTPQILEKLVIIPEVFVSEWVKTMLEVFVGLQAWNFVVQLIQFDEDVSEEVKEEIIDRFVLDLTVPIEVLKAGVEFFVDFIEEEIEGRLEKFQGIFWRILEAWDVPHWQDETFYPANYFLHRIVYKVTIEEAEGETRKRFIEVLMELCVTLLQPHHDPDSCFRLRFAHLLVEEVQAQELAGKISEVLPGLIGTFSTGMIQQMAHILLEQLNCVKFGHEEFKIELVRSLIRLRDDEVALLAASMMILLTPQVGKKKVLGILKSLQKYPCPAVMSVAYYTMIR